MQLSSHKYHFDDEPFILIIDQPAAEVDPLMAELLQLKQVCVRVCVRVSFHILRSERLPSVMF